MSAPRGRRGADREGTGALTGWLVESVRRGRGEGLRRYASPAHGPARCAATFPTSVRARVSTNPTTPPWLPPRNSVVGPIVGPLLGGGLSQMLGWRSTFASMGVCGVIILVALLVFMEETQHHHILKVGALWPTAGHRMHGIDDGAPRTWSLSPAPRTPFAGSRARDRPSAPLPPPPRRPRPQQIRNTQGDGAVLAIREHRDIQKPRFRAPWRPLK